LCPAAGGVLELSGVFGGRLSFSRSAAFSRSNASKRASNCTINASLSWALSKMKFGGESIPLSIQIRRRPATPFRACESIRHTCWQQCLNAGNQPSAGQGREQLPGLGRRNQWCNIRPLVIRKVARVPQVITIVFRSVLKRPHRRPLRESGHLL
jgi:hypothetical protein